MKNNLNSLNDYLFAEIERLEDDEELDSDPKKLDKEFKRAKAITGIGMTIVNNAKLILDARKYADEIGIDDEKEVLKLSHTDEKIKEVH